MIFVSFMKNFMSDNLAKPTNMTHLCIVDEDPLISELMKYNLESAGYEVSVFLSVDEAMDSNLEDYALYIIDVMMGGKDGFDFARYLKQNRVTVNTPLIFCSSRNNEEDVIDGLDLGADDYVLKPFPMKELVARVNALLRRRRITLGKAI